MQEGQHDTNCTNIAGNARSATFQVPGFSTSIWIPLVVRTKDTSSHHQIIVTPALGKHHACGLNAVNNTRTVSRRNVLLRTSACALVEYQASFVIRHSICHLVSERLNHSIQQPSLPALRPCSLGDSCRSADPQQPSSSSPWLLKFKVRNTFRAFSIRYLKRYVIITHTPRCNG